MKQKYRLVSDQVKENCISYIEGLVPKNEKPWEVVIQVAESKRSLEQNTKVHTMFQTVVDETGYHMEQAKYHVMIALGYFQEIEVNGQVIPVREQTHLMSQRRLSRLIEDMQAWGAEMGWYL